jgi:hypothetical protein
MPRSVLALLAATLTLNGCAGPARGPCADGTPLGTICGFEEPEDSEWMSAAGVLLVTNMRNPAVKGDHGGFLAALVPGSRDVRRVWPTGKPTDAAPDPQVGDPGCPGPLAGPTFSPHGLTSAGNLVYVVAHSNAGAREAVEIFAVDGQGADATVMWKGCIPQEPNVVANDIAVASDGEVIISNYESEMSLWNTLRAGALGSQTGDVMGWRRGSGWRHLSGTAASMANGVAVSADGQQVFWAETGTGKVHRTPRAGGADTSVSIGGNPDNLSWTSRGTLLVATHTGGPKFLLCALGSLPCRSPWAVFEIDPKTMTATQRFAHDGSVVGAIASATEVDGKTYLGSVFDDRIGVLTP